MSRAPLGILSLVVVVMGMTSRDGRPMSSTACFAPDSYSSAELAWLKTIDSSTNPVDSAWRAQILLPVVGDTAIVVVSDSTLCAEGLTAHNAAAQYADSELTDTLSQRVYLFRVGTIYVAANPHFTTGEWVMHYMFDSTFALKSSFAH